MFHELLAALMAWIQQNPHWAYFAVFLVAAGESLVVVGLLLPGVVLMFGFGALVAAGALDLGPTLFWAFMGAVAGDGLSFGIGRYFRQRLRVVWPFHRYPTLLNRGVAFFHQHGTKSVVLARFVGPVRPILPAVAGMLDMPARRFFTANVLSALLWAPAYTLPGVVFGASLAIAAEVTGRLAALLVLLVIVLWLGLWLVRLVFRFLQRRAGLLLSRALEWSRNHPRLKPLTAAVLDPGYPEAFGVAAILLIAAVASLVVAWFLSGWLVGPDLFVHAALQELRTPVADRVMVFITGLGAGALLFTVLGMGSTWLIVRGRHHAALHWLAAGLSALAVTQLLKLATAVPRPLDLLDGAQSFPSGHVSLGIAVYGFLAVLVARELAPRWRGIPYLVAALLVIPIAFSRLYLGAHWLSDVLAGAGIGFFCVALLGVAYRRHPARPLGWSALALVACLTMLTAGAWHAERHMTLELARYTQPRESQPVDMAAWWSQDWRRLAAQRYDFRAKARQPLTLQYAGDLETLAGGLVARGWRTPKTFSTTTALLWLSPHAEAPELPVLPQVHDGRHDALRLVRHAEDGETLYVLRLWPTRWQLRPGATPVWTGTVAELELRQPASLFSFVVTGSTDTVPFARLREDLEALCETALRRRNTINNGVLLARQCRMEP
jgi:membrane protein DedA with SNARE-associated domain/membrane-associated phospholipid phosphatase